MRIVVGPFVAREAVGSGGAATVYRAEHVATGAQVALKVLRPGPPERAARRAERFAEEVRAVAGLRHPCVVHVLDAGTVDAEAEAASGGELAAGSPYLAMEYASSGSLDRLKSVPPWPMVKGVALALLDALAHAHARGVVHRDLKPANVLLCGPRDLRPGLKLSDFGLAAAGGSLKETQRAGTLTYMAPEQVRGDWREFGPWTDLYALGGVIWRLVSGRHVFPGLTGPDLARAHLDQAPGPFEPRIPVPSGFRAWLDALLCKDPAFRTSRAADAALTLLDLGDPREISTRSVPLGPQHVVFGADDLPEISGPSASTPGLVLPDQTTLLWVSEAPEPAPRPAEAPILPGWHGVAASRGVAVSWRRGAELPVPFPLLGAGLSLQGARQPPFVGRERERDALWAALGRARAGATTVVLLRGPRGVGRSRLILWVGRRAHELGLADTIRLRCLPGAPAGETLRRLVADRLGTEGLTGDALRARVARGVRPDAVDAVAALLESGRVEAPGARFVAVDAALEGHAGRTLIVGLDDLHEDPDALAWVHHVLVGPARPLLIVASARDGALADHPGRRARLDVTTDLPGASALPVGPMAAGEVTVLVRHLLTLEPSLESAVVDRTGGMPRFAVDLVRGWAAAEALRPGLDGFTLRPERRVPAGLDALWTEEVDAALHALPAGVGEELERAACLGVHVRRGEWEAVCDGPSAARSAALDALASRALIELGPDSFTFRNPFLRTTLLLRCMEGGRERAHHARCADLVARLVPSDPERLGTHLQGAGRPAEALPHLMHAVRLRRTRLGYRSALALFRQIDRALDEAGATADDPRRSDAALSRANLRRLQGAFADAERWILPAEAAARRTGDSRRLVRALVELATCRIHRGELPSADACLKEAAAIARAASDREGLGMVRFQQAVVAGARQEGVAALALLERALEAFRALHHPHLADALRQRGTQLGALRRDAEARTALQEALALYEARGSSFGRAHCHNEIAELDRRAGDLASAEAGYRRAHGLFERLDDGQACVALLNLGMVSVLRGDLVGSLPPLMRAREDARRQGQVRLVAGADAVLLPGLAATGDWAAFDVALDDARQAVARHDLAEADIAEAAERAAELARKAGERVRARQALQLAVGQWRALGRPEADRVAERLSADPPG